MNTLKKIISGVLIYAIFQSFVFAQQRSNVVVLYGDKKTPATLYTGSYALVIGVSDYTNGWKTLPGVKEDVPAIVAALEKQQFVVETLMNPKDGDALEGRINQFINKYGFDYGNRLLIYFAGHGHTGKTSDGRNFGYIVPANAPLPSADADGFDRAAVTMDTILFYAERIRAKHALFVFDSCFSGELLSTRDSGEIQVPDFIEEQVAQNVRQFITAGAATQTVPDKSIFREFFVRGLAGEADMDGDGDILGSELANYLQKNVTNYSKRYETPQYGKIRKIGLDRGDFVFVVPKKESPTEVKTVPAPKPAPKKDFKTKTRAEIERDSWLLIQDSADAQDFRDFIQSFKGGTYHARAKARLEQIVWDTVKDSKDKVKIQAYLNEFPTGENVFAAKTILKKLEATATSAPIVTSNNNLPNAKSGAVKRNSIGMDLVYIPPGGFMMGSPPNENLGAQDNNESPRHRVSIREGFWMGKYEVTQEEYEKVAGTNPSQFNNCPRCPVENVSWDDAKEFISKLNAKNDGFTYSLPSEAEWEYAARAGTTTAFAYGDSLTVSQANFYPWYLAWDEKGWLKRTAAVGSYQPNAFGLYDMHGNVSEWTEDIYNENGYDGLSTDGSANVTIGECKRLVIRCYRVIRGGSWDKQHSDCRSARRDGDSSGLPYIGFRVVARLR